MSEKFDSFKNRLSKVYRHRSKIARKQNISCYRIYDLDMPEFPFCIDLYDRHVHVAEYKRNHQLNDQEHRQWLSESLKCISEIFNIDIGNIFLKERRVIENRIEQYDKYENSKSEIIVEENGFHFIVNLRDYTDTGLFLDHRITRKIVGESANGKKVLNLFAYTGSFSVYAAMGKAIEVHTIDLSNTYISWAKRNFEVNGLDGSYHFEVSDVMKRLPTLQKNYYDIVVCDPPTFSNSKKMEGILDTQRDHVSIIRQCIDLLRDDGCLYFSTNYKKFKMNFEAMSDCRIKDITKITTPFDFEGKLNRNCYLICKL